MYEDLVIGIDFGTTNCCVCVFKNGRVNVIENTEGDRITPSYLFFEDENDIIAGKYAKKRAVNQAKNVVHGMKRLVGRKFDDPHLQNLLENLAYDVSSDADNDPIVSIKPNKKTLKKTIIELCCILFKKLKQIVDNKYGELINKAVVTVPAYFKIKQRQAILQAATNAGFSVLKLLNEPTAAALFHYFEQGRDNQERSYSVVYDVGGGTFDVAVLRNSKESIEVISVGGDSKLGGHDFDNLIKDYVCEQIMTNYNCDLKKNKADMARLLSLCEEAKHALSSMHEYEIWLTGFVDGHKITSLTLTRQKFEELANDLFVKTFYIVEECLKNCKIDKKKIKEVILAGGSTRIPKIQKMLSLFFVGKPLIKFVNPDEAVARGAAIQAAMLSKHPSQKIRYFKLTDVVPLSIGIADVVGRMDFLIKKNTPIPCCATKTIMTSSHEKPTLQVKVYEGERLDVRKNRCIAILEISNITLSTAGKCEILFKIEVNMNGTLVYEAEENFKNNVKKLKIDKVRGDKSDFKIKSGSKNTEKMKTEDEKFEIVAEARAYLYEYCSAIIENLERREIADRFATIIKTCEKYKLQALNNYNDKSLSYVKTVIFKIKEECEFLIRRYKFDNMPEGF